MQKFTRPITREIELAGTRLALTLTDQGVSVRVVGTRRQPAEMSWATLMCHVAGRSPHESGSATAEEVAGAVDAIKEAPPQRPAMAAADNAPTNSGAAEANASDSMM